MNRAYASTNNRSGDNASLPTLAWLAMLKSEAEHLKQTSGSHEPNTNQPNQAFSDVPSPGSSLCSVDTQREAPTLLNDLRVGVKPGVSPAEDYATLFGKLQEDSRYWTLPGSTACTRSS